MTPPPLVAPIVHEGLGDRVYEIHLLRLRSVHPPERPGTSPDEHRSIAGAVMASDADRAEAVSRRVRQDAPAAGRAAAS